MAKKIPRNQQILITRIKQQKNKKSYSSYKLAAVAGVAESTVSRLLKGEVYPSIPTLIKLSSALQINIEDLIKDPDIEEIEIIEKAAANCL